MNHALALAAVLAFADLAPTTPPPGTGATEAGAEIQSTLEHALAGGYLAEDVDRILSVYAEDATVVNYVFGRMDLATLREKTLEDFSRLSRTTAAVEVLEEEPYEGGIIVRIGFRVTGVYDNDHSVNRFDRYYLDMRKDGGAWKIHRQSYRRDFGVSEFPHLGGR